MLDKLKGLGVLAVALSFVLLGPSITWGSQLETEYYATGFTQESVEPAEPAAEPAESAEDQADQPAVEPAGVSIEEPAEEPVEKPVEEPVENPSEESIEEPIVEPAEEPIEEPAEEPIEEPAEEPVEVTEQEAPAQIILVSVEGIPLEARVDFTLDGQKIGSVLDGLVVDAVPVSAGDRDKIKASVVNKVKITGAKINFELVPVVDPGRPSEPEEPVDSVELADNLEEPEDPTEP